MNECLTNSFYFPFSRLFATAINKIQPVSLFVEVTTFNQSIVYLLVIFCNPNNVTMPVVEVFYWAVFVFSSITIKIRLFHLLPM